MTLVGGNLQKPAEESYRSRKVQIGVADPEVCQDVARRTPTKLMMLMNFRKVFG